MVFYMQPVDTDLLKLCQLKDRKAQAQLYHVLFSTLMSVAVRYEKQRSDAKALVNLGFLKILNNLDKKRPDVPLEAWCRRIMINTMIDEHRKNVTMKATEIPTDMLAEHPASTTMNGVEQDIETEALEAMLYHLPAMSRKVFNLFVIDGYGHNEISAMLGISAGTSKWHVSNARQRLRSMLTQHTIKIAVS